jgi:hypothetical protein
MPQPPGVTPHGKHPRGARHGSWWHHVLEELPAALFVASAILIIHHETFVLDVLDRYTFALLGNLHAFEQHDPNRLQMSGSHAGKKKTITVLLIDDARYTDEYRQTLPLSRCALLRDIKTIYASKPSVLAIDLNISPALWLDNAPVKECKHASPDERLTAQCQAQCEHELYAQIADMQTQTRTVLMQPGMYQGSSLEYQQKRIAWMADMQSKGVQFGHPYLISRFGMLLDVDTRPDIDTGRSSLVEVTCKSNDGGDTCSEERIAGRPNIDPRNYLNGAVESFSMEEFTSGDIARRRVAGGVVFFGGDWGSGDKFLTPVGKLPGVEIHAVAFASIDQRFRIYALLNLFSDIAIGLMFSPLTIRYWKAYFLGRFSDDAKARQRALYYVAALCSIFIGFVLPAALLFSYFLMSWSIWASPVPVAIGMLIDGFSSSSVTQATRVGLGHLHQPIPHPRALRWLMHPAADIVNLWRKVDKSGRKGTYRGAAASLLFWRTVWVLVVGWCLYLVFH